MSIPDINAATTTNLKGTVKDFSVENASLDEPSMGKETEWNNENWAEYHRYYKTTHKLKKSIDALAMWTIGKG